MSNGKRSLEAFAVRPYDRSAHHSAIRMRDSTPTSSARLVAADASNLDVFLPLVRAFYEHFKYPYEQVHKRQVLERFIADESLGQLWLIERGGAPVGYVLVAFSFGFEFNGRVAFIDELFIDPSARSEGVGAQVLAEIEKWCQTVGVAVIRLEAETSNRQATALYIRSGYVDHNRRLLTKTIRFIT